MKKKYVILLCMETVNITTASIDAATKVTRPLYMAGPPTAEAIYTTNEIDNAATFKKSQAKFLVNIVKKSIGAHTSEAYPNAEVVKLKKIEQSIEPEKYAIALDVIAFEGEYIRCIYFSDIDQSINGFSQIKNISEATRFTKDAAELYVKQIRKFLLKSYNVEIVDTTTKKTK